MKMSSSLIAHIDLLTHHCPEVVRQFLPILQDSPKEEVSPRVITTTVHVWEVFLAVKKPTFPHPLLKKIHII